MTDPVVILERLTLVAPLGIRFWDLVSDTPIGTELTVTAYPRNNPAQRVPVIANRSGIYMAAHLPGLREPEQGAGDAGYWQRPAARRPFVVEVKDRLRRFQPFQFAIDLPASGLVTLDCAFRASPLASPPAGMPRVPLYSTPMRAAPGGMAVLRASLCDVRDARNVVPAAWVLLEARQADRLLGQGIADAKGQIVLMFPWPEPQVPGPPLQQQTWTIQVTAAYAPLRPVPTLPDLCAVLNQPPATLWADSDLHTPLTQVVLPFGQETVLRSRHAGDGSLLSELLVTPAGSPP